MDPADFYDDLAELYDLIYADWAGSMRRHGATISELLLGQGSTGSASSTRVLDVAAGIGTQALALAAVGFDVTARDLSGRAISRLLKEADGRGLRIDADQADMRMVGGTVTGLFDAVIAFDNSVPHLLDDGEILTAMKGWRTLLRAGGLVLLSVRDYDQVDRAPTSYHPYGERNRGRRSFRLGQEWTWVDADHYRTEMVVEERAEEGWREVLRTAAMYYAIPTSRLLELMKEAGFEDCRVADVQFYQPILSGRAV